MAERERDEIRPRRRVGALTWDADTGCWTLVDWRWLGVDGTTPRNAENWSLNLRLGNGTRSWEVWLRTGRHWGFTLWLGIWNRGWYAPNRRCRCYDCLVTGGPVRWFQAGEGKSRWWER